MKIGQTITETRIFTQADFDAFARLSGDDNPIHVDPAFAAGTRFGRTVAHGMFLYGVICGALSRHFHGAVQIEQKLMFPAPTFTGERMMVTAVVTEIMPEQQLRLKMTITNQQNALTCDGETVLQWDAEFLTQLQARKVRA